jgi:hypothetical protein
MVLKVIIEAECNLELFDTETAEQVGYSVRRGL